MVDVSFQISGREMFEFNPDLIGGDDDEAEDFTYTRDSDDEVRGIYFCIHFALVTLWSRV